MTARLSEALYRSSQARSTAVVTKIQQALRAIERDIEDNEGIYPYNGGRLSLAEVCRRAGIHKVTIQSPKHRLTTRHLVEQWLSRTKTTLTTGKKVVRRNVADRANQWKEKFVRAARWIDQYHREDTERAMELAELKAENRELRKEIIRLQTRQHSGTVTVLRPDKEE